MAAQAPKPVEPDPLLPAPAAEVPFAVRCPCGQTRSGKRTSREQILTCTGCGRRLFILPVSPWPTTEQDLASWADRFKQESLPTKPAPAASRRVWLQPLLAAGLTLVLVIVVFGVLLAYVRQSSDERHAAQGRGHAESARAALKRSDLHGAWIALERARRELERPGVAVPPGEVQGLRELERQVELALSLLQPSLEELLVEARRLPTQQWELRFWEAYLGRGVVFDARIDPAPAGGAEVRLDYQLEAEGTAGRVAVADFRSAKELFSQQSRRWIFGGKLAGMKLEADPDHQAGLWVVRFQPESLVLFTHTGVLKALGLAEEPTWDEVLRFQLSQQLSSLEKDNPEDVRRELGPPDRIGRQVLAGRLLEQWIYARVPPVRINLEHRPGVAPRIFPLGPARPR